MSLLDIFSYLQLLEQSLENEQKIGCCEKEVRESVQKWKTIRSGAICPGCGEWTSILRDQNEQICDVCGFVFKLRPEDGRVAFVTMLESWEFVGLLRAKVRFVDDKEGYVVSTSGTVHITPGASYLVPYTDQYEISGVRHIDIDPSKLEEVFV